MGIVVYTVFFVLAAQQALGVCSVLKCFCCGPSSENRAPAGVAESGSRLFEEGVEVLQAAGGVYSWLALKFPSPQLLPNFLFGVVDGVVSDPLLDHSLRIFPPFLVDVFWERERVVFSECLSDCARCYLLLLFHVFKVELHRGRDVGVAPVLFSDVSDEVGCVVSCLV